VILSAPYMLWLYSRVLYGPIEKPSLRTIADLDRREVAILFPLVALVIYYGIVPGPILDSFAASTEALIRGYQAALSTTQTAAAQLNVLR
jgi:NADH-quinone oxidoreductase subunit M